MLNLLKIYLDGFLSYDKEEIDLSVPGVTFIRGETGAGKSTLFEAIVWLLYGKTLKGALVGDLENKILSKGYEIYLDFSINKDTYRIKEIRGRKENGLYFFRGEEDLRGASDGETRKNIQKTLKIPFDEFKAKAFLGQGQSQELLSGTPAGRAGLIVAMFGLEKYDSMVKECLLDVSSQNSDVVALKSKLEDYQADIKDLEQSINNTEVESYDVDEKSLSELKDKIDEIEKKLIKISEKEIKLSKLLGMYSAIKESRKKLNNLDKEISEIESKLKNVKVLENIEDIESRLFDYRDKRSKIQQIISNGKSEIEKINRVENVCPITEKDCPSSIPAQYKKSRIAKVKKVLDENIKEIETYNKKITENEKAYSDGKKIDQLKKELNLKIRTRSNIGTDFEEINEEETIQGLSKCKFAMQKGKLKVVTYKDTYNELITAKKLKEQQEKFLKELFLTKERKLESLTKTEKEINSIELELKYIKAAAEIFKKCKLLKIDLILESLNENTKEILKAISDDSYALEFTTQKMDSKGKKTLDRLDILASDGYKTLPINMWSGGQSAIFGLATLLGAWKTSYELSDRSCSSLFLDEVFGPLSVGIINNVAKSVFEIMRQLGTTAIKMITHKDIDLTLVDHVWDVKFDNGISRLEVG